MGFKSVSARLGFAEAEARRPAKLEYGPTMETQGGSPEQEAKRRGCALGDCGRD